jgi:transposase
MSKGTKRQYTPEFKQQAVELSSRIGVSRAAKQLGISASNLHHWKAKGGKLSKPTRAEDLNLQEENRRLQKEVNELKQVNMILKRAAAFFSQDHLK